MTMAHNHDNMVPRTALAAACGLVVISLAFTSIARIAQLPPSASPALMRAADHAAVVKTRSLRFTDRADGAVSIIDTATGKAAAIIEPGSNSGFIRGVMRGYGRERRMRGIGPNAPVTLTLWQDGQLSLTDPSTGRSVELGAFGGTNRAAFLALLTNAETPL